MASETSSLLTALRAQRAQWPARARALWFIVLPLCTAAAVTASVVSAITGGSVVAAVGSSVLLILVRPIRRPWAAAPVIALVWLASPVIAAAVAMRTIVGVVAILLAGGSWRRGLVVVQRGRRALTQVDRPGQAAAKLRHSLQSKKDSEDALGNAIELWISVWTTADARRLTVQSGQLLRGWLFWRWPYRSWAAFEYQLGRLALIEWFTQAACRLTAVTATIVVSAVFDLAAPGSVFGWRVPTWAAYVVAGSVNWTVSRRLQPPPIVGPLILVVASLVLYGWHSLPVLGTAVLLGVPVPSLVAVLEARFIGSPVVPPQLPALVGTPEDRDIWQAARQAFGAERFRVARRLWAGLAQDDRRSKPVQAAAFAALSHVDLATGATQRAAESSEEALRLVEHAGRARGQVYGTAGRAQLAAGDTAAAKRLLAKAVTTSRRQGRDPLIGRAQAQVLAMDTDKDAALETLSRSWGGLFRGGNFQQLIDSELAVADVLATNTPPATVAKSLTDLLSFDELGDQVSDVFGQEQIQFGMARVRLLLGRLQLQDRKPSVAATTLRLAVNAFTAPAAGFEQAVARILLGAAINQTNGARGLPELTAGVRQLESLRGQLALGAHRNQLIGRHNETYQFALDAMERLQRHDPGAARLAAELVESLRRSSLARMLREDNPDLGPAVHAVNARITALERQAFDPATQQQLDQLHDQVGRAVSTAFADAYLPEQVDLERLRRASNGAHCLTYHLRTFTSTEVRGHLIWARPDGSQLVHRIAITEPSLLAALGAVGDEDDATRVRIMNLPQTRNEFRRWHALSEALLPSELRATLLGAAEPVNLLVVPDSSLSAFPWAALRCADGRVLAEAAIIQLVPALALVDSRSKWSASRAPAVCAYVDPDVASSAEEAALRQITDSSVISRDALLATLRAGSHSGVYLAVHGNGLGLAQRMEFHDGSILSAAAALSLPWPEWVLFASCFVARVKVDHGEDPLGLPISCLLGGAKAVVGGIIPVNSIATGKLCPDVARRVVAGAHPAAALREAQVALLRSHGSVSTLARWAGFVCVSRVVPS